VDAPRFRVDVVLKRVGIGRFQFRQLPPVEHAARQVVFGGKVFQHVGAGGIGARLAALAAVETHLVEEDLAQLLGRAHVEGFACQFVDFRFQRRHLLGEGVRHAAERVAVDLDAGHLHPRQNRHHGALQRLVDGGDARQVKLRAERLPEPQGDVGVLGP
jgi:hypothetical protein